MVATFFLAHLGAFLSPPLRSGRVQMSQAIAPPALPPTYTGGGGGGGGGGDGPGEFLRMLTSSEVRRELRPPHLSLRLEALDAWAAVLAITCEAVPAAPRALRSARLNAPSAAVPDLSSSHPSLACRPRSCSCSTTGRLVLASTRCRIDVRSLNGMRRP
eukprot:scaffold6813_cov123-Isochrysis_galbana.AAC.9